MGRINDNLRPIVNKRNIKKLRNKDFSVICNNCNGAFILHDLHLRFLSPTVNLWISPDEYIKFLTDLKKYTSCELTFSDEKEAEMGYPVGVLDGEIYVYFQHYKSREHAQQKWCERCSRINFDNLFIMLTPPDKCNYQILKAFDELPYKNKIVFTTEEYPDIKSAFYMKGFENKNYIMWYQYKSKLSGKRHYDNFPYVKWFNGEL